MRALLSLTLLVAVAAPAVADEPKPVRQQFSELQRELAAEVSKLNQEYAGKALAIAEANPDDPASFDVAMQAMTWGDASSDAKAVSFLSKHFGNDPRFMRLIPTLARTADGRRTLAELAEKSDVPQIKAVATYTVLENRLYDFDRNAVSRPVSADEAEREMAEISEELDELIDEFGDQKSAVSPTAPTVKEAAGKLKFFVEHLTVGKTPPDVEVENLNGKTEKLSDYKGKVVVLDVWATWCGPCKAMIPHERAMVEKLKDKPFELISVSADDQKATLTDFLKNEEMPWTHWWVGRGQEFSQQYQIRFYPTIFVIDKQGVIRHKHLRGEKLEEAVEKLLEEAGQQ